jgi:hypothetical protein
MLGRDHYKVFLFVLLNWLTVFSAQAQFQQLPTPVPSKKENHHPSGRIMQSPLSLPFWDDFSSPEIDSTKWINEGVTHSFTVGNSAPSLGVLLFDGVDEQGRAYANVPFEQGITDQITSQVIDLSNLTEEESSTVYLSFFWQAGGKAELPDFNDNLILFLLDTAETWVRVWDVSGGLEAEQFFFTKEIIQIPEAFQHENFQFRFQITGRASGPFDAWLLDYVYLNKNRNETDLFSPDRALTQTNTSPLGKYTAIPLFELKNKTDSIWQSVSNEFNNLENRFRAMEYSIELRNKTNNQLITRINNNTPFNPVPLANERRGFTSNSLEEIELPDEETDLELITYISSGDRFLYQIINGDSIIFNDIDLRLNDTVKTTIPIRDYYAYDDGSIDYSAGINQRNGMLANRFETNSTVYIKGISINFTNFLQANTFVDLNVWNSLNNEPLFKEEIFIPEKETLEEFAYFELEENVSVQGEFFVGFTQFTNDFVYVGLDKTSNNGNEIFYNVAGSWQQNEQVEGSLMIRVHLSETPLFQDENESSISFKVYPNPVEDWLTLEGEVENFLVFDPYGRPLNLPTENSPENFKMINFAGLQKGVYLLQFSQNGQQKSVRVLVK